jgi:hypothetical protein
VDGGPSTLLSYRKQLHKSGAAGVETNRRRIGCQRSLPVITSDSDENISKARGADVP